ncbi:MAG: replication-associated recombination protein A, partial [Glutamicibacter arilaitensis]
MSDLFDSLSDDPREAREPQVNRPRPPLAVRMRPKSLDELVGQQHLLGPGSPLRQLAENPETGLAGPASVILYGPPGIGKTTIAHVIARATDRKFVELSAITAGVKDVRRVIEQAKDDRDLRGVTTVLFLDEIHRFNKAQQDALLPGVENRVVVLVAATTENPSFSVISPLLSRSLLLTLRPLTDGDLSTLLERAVSDERGFNDQVILEEEQRDAIVRLAQGDARRSLTVLEAAGAVAWNAAGAGVAPPVQITADHVQLAMDQAVQRYDKDGDQHYDIISAFIKSIRGSDVDAALHYLARMLSAGEDPRFIARRLMISASEDIGMADPTALPVAVAVAQSVQLTGMPEARIMLGQATVHLATAPKSNASYNAINAALADVSEGKGSLVPDHLRDAHYPGAKQLGHGVGY